MSFRIDDLLQEQPTPALAGSSGQPIVPSASALGTQILRTALIAAETHRVQVAQTAPLPASPPRPPARIIKGSQIHHLLQRDDSLPKPAFPNGGPSF